MICYILMYNTWIIKCMTGTCSYIFAMFSFYFNHTKISILSNKTTLAAVQHHQCLEYHIWTAPKVSPFRRTLCFRKWKINLRPGKQVSYKDGLNLGWSWDFLVKLVSEKKSHNCYNANKNNLKVCLKRQYGPTNE